MRYFEKIITSLNGAMMWGLGFLMLLMGFIVTLDIITRTLFQKPLTFVFELVGLLCAAMALLGGGYSLSKGGHVKIDIIYNRFSYRVRAILDVCTFFFFFLLCFVLVWMGFTTVFESIQSGATTGAGLNPPLFIPQLLVPVGGVIIGLQGVALFARRLKAAITGNREEGDD